MRKEIKRSLLVWPLLASATISSICWYSSTSSVSWLPSRYDTAFSIVRGVSSLNATWNSKDPESSWDRWVADSVEPSEELAGLESNTQDHLEATLADLLRKELDAPASRAPRFDEKSELAGLSSLRNSIASLNSASLNAAAFGVRQDSVRPELPAGDVVALHSPHQTDSNAQSWSAEMTDVSPVNRPAPFQRRSSDSDDTPEISIIPRSVRVLGRYRSARGAEDAAAASAAERNEFVDVEKGTLVLVPAKGKTLPSVATESMHAEGTEAGASQAELRHTQPHLLYPNDGQLLSSDAIEKSDVVDQQPPAAKTGSKTRLADKRNGGSESTIGWPVAAALHQRLSGLTNDAPQSANELAAKQWAFQVETILGELESLPWLGNVNAGTLLQELATFAAAGEQMAEASDDRELQKRWLQASHALTRRLAVWGPIWKVVDSGGNQDSHTEGGVFSSLARDTHSLQISNDVLANLDSVAETLVDSGDVKGWTEFLLLDAIRDAVERDDANHRAELAQRFLSRLQWYGLHEQHQDFLRSDSIVQLAESLQAWSVTPIDYAKLVRHIERQENDAIDLTSIEIADAVQSLRFSRSAPSVAVAGAINRHYRNANFRFAVSDEMLRRLLPPVASQVKPVRGTLLGSKILGTSRVSSRLDLRLVPSPDRWALELRTLGRVKTQSVGLNGPVAIRTSGRSSFESATPIELMTDRVQIGDTQVAVNNQNRLQGIRTDYDGLPLIGSLIRSIAATQYEDTTSISNRFSSNQVRKGVESEVDSQVHGKLSEATTRFSDVVVGPLGRLGLEPMVVDMQTTASRLIARYRLAGDWQMGAFTPRPRAPSDSLMSLQVHQSAINNTLEQLIPRDQPTSIAEMVSDGILKFGASQKDVPAGLPEDVKIQFAATRPITVEIEEDGLWLTLRVEKLTRGDQLSLKRFIVRARYRPKTDGVNASLVREGSLRISGPRISMRQRLPVRAIFNTVMEPDRPLPITLPKLENHPAMEGLEVSQLELRDGWIGLAFSRTEALQIASHPQSNAK